MRQRRLRIFDRYECYRCDAEFAVRTGTLDGTPYCPNCGGNDAVGFRDQRELKPIVVRGGQS